MLRRLPGLAMLLLLAGACLSHAQCSGCFPQSATANTICQLRSLLVAMHESCLIILFPRSDISPGCRAHEQSSRAHALEKRTSPALHESHLCVRSSPFQRNQPNTIMGTSDQKEGDKKQVCSTDIASSCSALECSLHTLMHLPCLGRGPQLGSGLPG